jgi:hypothetical protein
MNIGLTTFMADCIALAAKKNFDYHPDGVAYLEILQTAFETGITVEQDLWGRVRKQMSALRRFVIEGYVESETPKSRMMDVANYMAILAFWTEHKHRLIKDAFEFVRDNRLCERHKGNGWSSQTCIAQGEDKCDRCLFVMYLMKQEVDADPALSASRS